MVINSRDLFFLFARSICFLLALMAFLLMISADEFHLHRAFTVIKAASSVSMLWNGIWLLTHVSYMCRGVGHINASFAFLIPAEWVITGMAIAPASMALGVVVFLDHDTHMCERFLYLAAMCSRVKYAASSYLLAGFLNLSMALRESWALAAAYPIHLQN